MRSLITTLLICSSAAYAEQTPPELWSWFKDLNKSKEACEIQSSFVLQELGVANRTENDYGIYGNVKSNRVAVKCIAISDSKSKLMVAVAGNDRSSVELVRNKIVQSIK